MKGKRGPKPLEKGEPVPSSELPADAKPLPVRCAGCESTEVIYRDNEGFYYCEKDECVKSCRGEITKLEGEDLEKVRAQNSAAGAPLPPTPEEGAALRERQANGKEPKGIAPFPRAASKVLPVKLTDVEFASYRTRLSDEVAQLRAAEDEKKDVTAGITDRIKTHKKEIDQLSMAIENGIKHEDVPCEWRPLWAENAKELVRLDNGERVDMQPLTYEDRQLEIKEVTDKNKTETEAAAAAPVEAPVDEQQALPLSEGAPNETVN